MNNISIVGRLTKDVTIAQVGESWVIRGTVADNYYKPKAEDKTGVNFVGFSRFVRNEPQENFLSRLKKGSSIAIVGRLEVNERKDEKTGTTYQNLSVLVNDMTTFSPGSLENSNSDHTHSETTTTAHTSPVQSEASMAAAVTETDDVAEEELPF
tara:strand:- start:2398 stop:2859 length:462 start_codon:yes stop_codon:yes gene_type:complete